MNILLASAEIAPLVKSGGLADITSSLPVEWQKFGQNVIAVIPKYREIDTEKYGFKPLDSVLYVPMGWWMEYARLWQGTLPGSGIPVYLIENNDYYDRDGIYGNPDEFGDNDRRFIFFSRAVFETAKTLSFVPDIIHAHDYHTAFSLAFLKSQYRHTSMFSRTAGVYTIHNLAYQGWFDPVRSLNYAGFGSSEFYQGSWFEKNGVVNAMKTGIMFADKITTVSPTYSKEIRTPYYGEGLQDELNLRGADLIGILNGVHYDKWDPGSDKFISSNYDSNSLEKKKLNKIRFLTESGLTEKDNLDLPLIGSVSRLTEQKGIDLIREKLEHLLDEDRLRFVILGSGERQYIDYFNYLKYKYPKKALVTIGYNEEKAHRILAASDFFVMPSRFEPCGLTQMYALKYGAIPIVRSTGGLADTVSEYIPGDGTGTGFVFLHYYADDFLFAINRALRIYGEQPHWDLIRKNAMKKEFSSSFSALEYLKVFKWAVEKVRG